MEPGKGFFDHLMQSPSDFNLTKKYQNVVAKQWKKERSLTQNILSLFLMIFCINIKQDNNLLITQVKLKTKFIKKLLIIF